MGSWISYRGQVRFQELRQIASVQVVVSAELQPERVVVGPLAVESGS